LASAFARDSEIEVPAKLRSEEIDLLRMLGGDIMLVMLSRDSGSEILATTSETLFIMPGILPAKRTALSIWYIALSNRIEPISLFPERGSSMLLAVASSGWVQSCWYESSRLAAMSRGSCSTLAFAVGGSTWRGIGEMS
jgi:hypothetical protein